MSYNKLRGKIREVFGTQESFAEALGVSKVGVSLRLNGKVKWTLDEVTKCIDLLGIEGHEIPEYFFTPKVR